MSYTSADSVPVTVVVYVYVQWWLHTRLGVDFYLGYRGV